PRRTCAFPPNRGSGRRCDAVFGSWSFLTGAVMATKVQVVFYSMYGHIYKMVEAVAAGAREVPDTEVSVYQVPELASDEVLQQTGAKAARAAFAHIPIAKPDQLAQADAVIFGAPTRFGNMCAQMRNFLDQTGGLWMNGG